MWCGPKARLCHGAAIGFFRLKWVLWLSHKMSEQSALMLKIRIALDRAEHHWITEGVVVYE